LSRLNAVAAAEALRASAEASAGEELARLLERAQRDDATVLPALRRVLDASPEFMA